MHKIVLRTWATPLVNHLATHPEELYALTPRAFEELVADILQQLFPAATISLCGLGKDGGVDIFVDRVTDVGPEQLVVQCKRFRQDRKMGTAIVKQLHADLNDRSATRGLVVTTSYFTQPAVDYIERRKYRLGGADFERLRLWLVSLRSEN